MRRDVGGAGERLATCVPDAERQLGGREVPIRDPAQILLTLSPLPLPLRLGEGGKIGKGPVGMGLRLQDTLRIGAFKVEACAAKVTTDGAQGGKDEAWGGRAFVRYDWLPVRGREGGQK